MTVMSARTRSPISVPGPFCLALPYDLMSSAAEAVQGGLREMPPFNAFVSYCSLSEISSGPMH
jgi:hypothetical protein